MFVQAELYRACNLHEEQLTRLRDSYHHKLQSMRQAHERQLVEERERLVQALLCLLLLRRSIMLVNAFNEFAIRQRV